MTMPSNPPAAPSPRALAQQRYNQALELDKQLRGLLQSKGPFDPSVRALRNRICENFEAVILEDREFAESHEVEQGIWRLHYKCIEEYRARIRKNASAAAAAAAAPAIPVPGVKVPPARRDSSNKILSVFKSFLAEATGFYHNLMLKLRAKHGLPQDYCPFEAERGPTVKDNRRVAELKGCDLSCHRCLIFLGDLARYKESHGDTDPRNRDWSVAAGYYQQAISLWPSGGNPHNQLAVLATYVGDELLAVYRYFRSLAVESPFLTARDNLIILFEKNRNHYAQLPSHDTLVSASKLDTSKTSDKIKIGRGDRILPVGDGALKLAVKGHNLEGADIGEIRKSFCIRFVRLNGILFTKTSLETFGEVYSATVRELEMLLSPDDASLEVGLGSEHRSGIGTGSRGAAGFLQLISILIFTVHNINWGSDSHHPTYAEILQRSALFQHAFTAAFECAGRLMRRCADSKEVSKSPLLPAILVFLEWLACRPEMARGSDVDGKQANAQNFFWRQSISLLNNCAETIKVCGDGDLEGSLGSLNVMVDEKSTGGVALWEDFELRGFVSLVPAQLTLDYSKRAPWTGLGGKKERDIRVQRLLAAGKAIVNALEGTEKGICYDEDLEKFVMVGETREKLFQNADVCSVSDSASSNLSALPEDVVDELEELRVLNGGWIKDSSGNSNIVLPSKAAFVRVEEEDEEVIVFKPVLKESQVNVSALDGVWKDLVGVQTSMSSSIVPSYGDSHILDGAREAPIQVQIVPQDSLKPTSLSADVGQFVMHSSLDLPVSTSHPMLTSQGASSAVSLSSTFSPGFYLSGVSPVLPGIHGLLKDDDSEVGKSPYGCAPSSAADWLNHMGRPGTGALALWDAPTSMFVNGSEKSPASAGVIGQPKQTAVSNSLWSTGLDSFSVSGLSSLTLANSDYSLGPIGSLGGGLPDSTLALDSLIQASVKETNGTSLNEFVDPSPSNGFLYGAEPSRNNAHNGTIGNFMVAKPTAYVPSGNAGSFTGTRVDKVVPVHNNCIFGNGASTPGTINGTFTPKANGLTSTKSSGMRPPPGFGPLPSKSLASSFLVDSQSVSKPLRRALGHDGEEHLHADDYGWLDDYSRKGNTGQVGYYQGQGSSLYSSDFGIWSSGGLVDPTPVSKTSTTYPFPGMVDSEQEQLDGQRQPYSAQLFQRLLQQQPQQYEGPRVEYGVEQPQLPFGRQYEYQRNHVLLLQQKHLLSQQQQLQLQPQQQLQQQQQQQMWYGQYHSRDPFVS